MGENLLIVGNGFDIHYGLKTSFKHFKEWYKVREDIDYFEGDLPLEENWSNIEDALSYIDYETIYEYALNSGGFNDYGSKDWKDRDHHVHMQVTEFLLKFKIDFLKYLLEEVESELLKLDYCFNTDFTAVNFNYTSTLEKFDVNSQMQIHGSIANKNIIFGHNNEKIKADKFISLDEYISNGELVQELQNDPRELELIDLFVNINNNTLNKNSESNLDKLRKFLNDKKYEKIVFVGFSFGDQDKLYYNYLLNDVKCRRFEFYCYTAEDKNRVEEIVKDNLKEWTINDSCRFFEKYITCRTS